MVTPGPDRAAAVARREKAKKKRKAVQMMKIKKSKKAELDDFIGGMATDCGCDAPSAEIKQPPSALQVGHT